MLSFITSQHVSEWNRIWAIKEWDIEERTL